MFEDSKVKDDNSRVGGTSRGWIAVGCFAIKTKRFKRVNKIEVETSRLDIPYKLVYK